MLLQQQWSSSSTVKPWTAVCKESLFMVRKPSYHTCIVVQCCLFLFRSTKQSAVRRVACLTSVLPGFWSASAEVFLLYVEIVLRRGGHGGDTARVGPWSVCYSGSPGHGQQGRTYLVETNAVCGWALSLREERIATSSSMSLQANLKSSCATVDGSRNKKRLHGMPRPLVPR